MDLRDAIGRLSAGRSLTADEAAAAASLILDGRATPAQAAAFLFGLRMRGETVDELIGLARALRRRLVPLTVPSGADRVALSGTGGDGRRTVNVTTLAALVVAACGVPLAHQAHGAISSLSGSADLLAALGVDLTAPPDVATRCLLEVGCCVLPTATFHPSLAVAEDLRRELGVRTAFLHALPLAHPLAPQAMLVGAPDPAQLDLLAGALFGLGATRGLLVSGSGGLDEFSPAGPTEVVELRGGEPGAPSLVRYRLAPRDFGLEEGDPLELRGGDAQHNARQARALLSGTRTALRTAVVMTAAAGLFLAGENGFRDGAQRAAQAIDEGTALRLLQCLVAITTKKR